MEPLVTHVTRASQKFNGNPKILKEKTVLKQEPFAAVLSCADSRVPVEILFDQSIGHVFVARVVGNMVTPEIIASLEYGLVVLGIKAFLVMGTQTVEPSAQRSQPKRCRGRSAFCINT